jgi:hypothetical protein
MNLCKLSAFKIFEKQVKLNVLWCFRQEYDCQLNAVTVTLLFGHCYVCNGGYVKARDSQLLTNTELTIDRRKPLRDLLTQIKEVSLSSVIHVVRNLREILIVI